MVYSSSANLAWQYFIDMGNISKPRQTTPDFLVPVVSVTDPPGSTTVTTDNDTRNTEMRGCPIPQTPAEFEVYYKASNIRDINHTDIESYKRDNANKHEKIIAFRESARADHSVHTRLGVRVFALKSQRRRLQLFVESLCDIDTDAGPYSNAASCSDSKRELGNASYLYNVSVFN